MRQTMGKVARLKQVAEMGQIDLATLLSGIAGEIREKAGIVVTIAGDGAAREEVLKGIILDLHRGEDMELLKQRFRDLVKDISPSEIAELEQRLIAEGLPESEVRRLCDVHVEVFKESLARQEVLETPPGHPLHTFMMENRVAESIVGEIQGLLDGIGEPADEKAAGASQQQLSSLVDRLAEIDRHYLRKENQLFPLLEVHEVSGPSKVMWAIHDEIRASLKAVHDDLAASRLAEAVPKLVGVLTTITDMIYKEENILFPMSLETLTAADWSKVHRGEEDIGFAWVEPVSGWVAEAITLPEQAGGGEEISLNTGALTAEQVNLVLNHLPVDITFVDENDRVAYFSRGSERIFPRSQGIIGRHVQNCHPPDSVHVVTRILDSFRAGEKDAAEFWIELHGRFIYIRYFAVRSAGGTYRGCLEVSQDVTGARQLEGQRRLLDWE